MATDFSTFTLSSPAADVARAFDLQGYVVFENLLPESRLDDVLSALARLKRAHTAVYYSQSVHRWVRPRLSSGGFIVDSMENPSCHINLPSLRAATMQVIYDRNVVEALRLISGKDKFVSWQDMLFDRSVGTVDHQDTWYLDTRPPGALIAGWFALEDIHPDSGPFHIYPGSHRLDRVSEDEVPVHSDFVSRMRAFVRESGIEKKPALLKKGQVLFWHPNLVHGAELPRSESHSRKSLTSHYYPQGLLRKDSISLDHDRRQMKPTENPAMHRKGIPELQFVAKGYAKFLWDAIRGQQRPVNAMSRSEYV